jgi:drug/metabolite transporter (DMT)-like permease
VSRRHLTMLFGLAAIWGSSFMLIEIALRDLEPSTVILARIASGALALGVYLRLAGYRFGSLRPYAAPLAMLGLVNTALPFFLIAWGQTHIDSGLAAILNASAPLFSALFALSLDRSQRVAGLRLAGVGLGFGGVVLLVGFELGGGAAAVAGGLAVVAASALYGIGGLYAGRRFDGLPSPLVALGTLLWATVFTLPLGAAQASMPGWEAIAAVLCLGVAATGAAYLLYFGLIAGAGAAKAVLVTYLVPALALVYGAVFLDEQVTPVALAGLALVLAGVALGTGVARNGRGRRQAAAAKRTPSGVYARPVSARADTGLAPRK